MKMMQFVMGVLAGGLVATVLSTAQWFPTGVAGAHTVRVERVAPGPEVAGVRFVPQAVPSQASAQAGRTLIPKNEAVGIAERISDAWSAGGLQAGVRESARFGLYSNDDFGPVGASGIITPTFQDVQVWYVTFSGLSVPSVRIGGVVGNGLNNREENVVVNASTGQVLDVFTYK